MVEDPGTGKLNYTTSYTYNALGGRTTAILASLTSTCRRHDVDPQLYLTQLLVNLPSLRARELPAWLPDQRKRNQTPPPEGLPK